MASKARLVIAREMTPSHDADIIENECRSAAITPLARDGSELFGHRFSCTMLPLMQRSRRKTRTLVAGHRSGAASRSAQCSGNTSAHHYAESPRLPAPAVGAAMNISCQTTPLSSCRSVAERRRAHVTTPRQASKSTVAASLPTSACDTPQKISRILSAGRGSRYAYLSSA